MTRNHIIHKQVLDVDFPSKNDAVNGQHLLETMFLNEILPFINTVFDDLSGEDRVHLDRIEIDLGVIARSDFEDDVPRLVSDKLRDELFRQIQKQYPGGMTPAAYISANGLPFTNEKFHGRSDTRGTLEEFRFFIENGRLPWWSAGETPTQMAGLLLTEHPVKFFKLIQILFESDTSRRRLIYQLPDSILSDIVETGLRASGSSENMKAVFNDLIKLHKKKQIMQLSTSRIRLLFWETALTVSLTQSAGSAETSRLKKLNYKANASKFSLSQLILVTFLVRIAGERSPSISSRKRPEDIGDSYTRLLTNLQTRIKKTSLKKSELFRLLTTLSSLSQADKSNILDEIYYKVDEPGDKKERSRATLQNKKPIEEGDSIEIPNAGLVIPAQFFPMFFEAVGLVKKKEFVTAEAAKHAALLLQYALTGDTDMPEQELILNKILCGLPPDEPLPRTLHISKQEDEEVNNLLTSVTEHWKALKGTSMRGLRQTFLNRPGLLTKDAGGWNIYVERITVDILLDHLPWSISIIKMPWNDEFIHVEW